jgi:hypothetical protein
LDSNPNIDDIAVEQLARNAPNQTLLTLDLSSTSVTDNSVALITRKFPLLVSLGINQEESLTFPTLKRLITEKTSLQRLECLGSAKPDLLLTLRDLKPTLFSDISLITYEPFFVDAQIYESDYTISKIDNLKYFAHEEDEAEGWP